MLLLYSGNTINESYGRLFVFSRFQQQTSCFVLYISCRHRACQ